MLYVFAGLIKLIYLLKVATENCKEIQAQENMNSDGKEMEKKRIL